MIKLCPGCGYRFTPTVYKGRTYDNQKFCGEDCCLRHHQLARQEAARRTKALKVKALKEEASKALAAKRKNKAWIGKNSRNKGIIGERDVANMFKRWFLGCRRSFGQARQGFEQPDILGGGIEDHFFVEVKRGRRITEGQLKAHWTKALEDEVKYRELHQLNEPLPTLLIWRIDHSGDWWVGMGGHTAKTLGLAIATKIRNWDTVKFHWNDFSKAMDKNFTVRESD